MTRLRYDIIPQSGGWSIAMGGAVGPPYYDLETAVRDTENVAGFLTRGGDTVEIVLWKGGTPKLIAKFDPPIKRRDH